MATAKNGLRGSRAAVVMAVCIMVVLWASGAHGAVGVGEEVQITHRGSATTMAFEQRSLFECPCSYQYCDDATYSICSCNVNVCSCSCHNSDKFKIPPGLTIHKLPTP